MSSFHELPGLEARGNLAEPSGDSWVGFDFGYVPQNLGELVPEARYYLGHLLYGKPSFDTLPGPFFSHPGSLYHERGRNGH